MVYIHAHLLRNDVTWSGGGVVSGRGRKGGGVVMSGSLGGTKPELPVAGTRNDEYESMGDVGMGNILDISWPISSNPGRPVLRRGAGGRGIGISGTGGRGCGAAGDGNT